MATAAAGHRRSSDSQQRMLDQVAAQSKLDLPSGEEPKPFGSTEMGVRTIVDVKESGDINQQRDNEAPGIPPGAMAAPRMPIPSADAKKESSCCCFCCLDAFFGKSLIVNPKPKVQQWNPKKFDAAIAPAGESNSRHVGGTPPAQKKWEAEEVTSSNAHPGEYLGDPNGPTKKYHAEEVTSSNKHDGVRV